jgi:hypothetical protein
MNEEANMSEKIKLTNNVGVPVADNQNVMTAGPRFCDQKMCDVLLTILQVSHCHQDQLISPLKLIRQMGTEARYS